MAVHENEVEATCTTDGSFDKVVYCKHCKAELLRDKRPIPAGHTAAIDAAIAASCVDNGLTEGSHCDVCNEVLVEQEVVPALGHKSNKVEGSAVAATCTQSGHEDNWECSRCNAIFIGDLIPALGHNMGEFEVVEKATCDQSGLKKRQCSRCNHEETESIPATGIHNWINDAYCADCNKENPDYHPPGEPGEDPGEDPGNPDYCSHEFMSVGDDFKQATCTEAGYTGARTCGACGYTEAGEDIPALGHDLHEVEGSAVEPTCTEGGHDPNKACSRCDYVEAGTALGATGHNEVSVEAKAATCTEAGREAGTKCSVCGKILFGCAIIEATGHDMQEVAGTYVAPSCEIDGKEADKKCSRCEYVETGKSIYHLSHDYTFINKDGDDGDNAVDNYHTVTCSRCDYTFTQPHDCSKGDFVYDEHTHTGTCSCGVRYTEDHWSETGMNGCPACGYGCGGDDGGDLGDGGCDI